jgi:hypothetical protein
MLNDEIKKIRESDKKITQVNLSWLVKLETWVVRSESIHK